MIKCVYCNSFLVSLSGNERGDQQFCTNCNCSFYLKENKLVITSFSFYLNGYYFGINLNHEDNNTSINGAYYPTMEESRTSIRNYTMPIKKFDKTFDHVINITPQNAAKKVKLYMTFS